MLGPSGRIGTVTWVREDAARAYAEWDAALSEAGAAPLPTRRVDVGLNSEEGMEALFGGAGLRATHMWTAELERRWERNTYWDLATGSGLNRLRLEQLDLRARDEAIKAARARLDALPADAFWWSGQVLCAVGTKA